MKKNLIILVALTISTFTVFFFSLFTFFAQDDFILINHFSQNNITVDLENVFGQSKVTHWRPIHNLYFFSAGNIFGKNYLGYHLITFFFHIGSSFLIYKITRRMLSETASFFAAFFYILHPAHFIALTWISGASTTIGFFFLMFALFLYLRGSAKYSIFVFGISLLASEAMLAGLSIFLFCEILNKKRKIGNKFLFSLFLGSIVFLIFKFFLTDFSSIFSSYRFSLSLKNIYAIKFYLQAISNLKNLRDNFLLTGVLLASYGFIFLLFLKGIREKLFQRQIIFGLVVLISGLFPFILFPMHLSPHYMNISIFGLSFLISLILTTISRKIAFILLIIFILSFVVTVNKEYKRSWVLNRSRIAKTYLTRLEKSNLPKSSRIVFEDSEISTSFEAYISLGTGEAIKFWFPDKNYSVCFENFENCTR